MEAGSRRVLIVALLVVVVVGALVYLQSGSSGCGDLRVEDLCATTSMVRVLVTGSCGEATLVFYDANGVERARLTVQVGEEATLPVNPNLPPGDYTVKVYSGDSEVSTIHARVYTSPFLINVKALVWPNGTVFVDALGRAPPCMEDYSISAVVVTINGTSYNFTGPWPVGELIRVDTGVEVDPNTIVQVVVWDSLGRPYSAAIAMPR